jgi:hypothetical protein
MSRINFGLSPMAMGGSLMGGLAEGLAAGSLISQRRQQNALQKQQMEQARFGQAIQLLQALPKVAETDPQMAEAMYGLVKGIAGGGGAPGGLGASLPPTMNFDPAAGAARTAEKKAAQVAALNQQADKLGLAPGSAEREKFIYNAVLTEKKERSPYVIGGKTYMLTDDQAARMDMQMQLKELGMSMRGGRGGGGGGGGKNLVPWMDKNGKFLGYAPKTAPPSPDAVPGTASAFKPQTQKVTPFSPNDIYSLTTLGTKVEDGTATPLEAAIWERMGGSTREEEVEETHWFSPPTKKKVKRAIPPRGKTVTPPSLGYNDPDEE